MDEQIKPGSVAVEEFTLLTDKQDEFDLKTYIHQLSIFEDIFSNTLYGTALISDNNNLVGTIPIIGREIITIKYRVPGFQTFFYRSFFIYKVEDRSPTSGDRQQMYTLHFMGIEALVDNVTYLSRKYSGYTDEIAERIFTEHLVCPRVWNKQYPFPSGLSTQNTFLRPEWRQQLPKENLNTLSIIGNRPFASRATWVVPMWTPFKAMNWLANRSIDGSSNAPNVLFWESSHGFHFSSIDAIFEKQQENPAKKSFYYGLDEAAFRQLMAQKNTINTVVSGYEKVEAVHIPQFTDMLKSQDYGHLSSNLHTFDIATKQYKEYIYDYASNFNTFRHLDGERPAFNPKQARSIYSYRMFRPIHNRLFNDYEAPRYEKWVSQRTSLLYDYSNLRVEITVFGFCDIEVGEVVNFFYPRMTEKNMSLKPEELIDPYLSGAYMVAAIRHMITESKYVMRVELIKESLSSSLG